MKTPVVHSLALKRHLRKANLIITGMLGNQISVVAFRIAHAKDKVGLICGGMRDAYGKVSYFFSDFGKQDVDCGSHISPNEHSEHEMHDQNEACEVLFVILPEQSPLQKYRGRSD